MATQPEQISMAKGIEHAGKILGYQHEGRIFDLGEGKFAALKHDKHRFNGGLDGWGRRDGAYLANDMMPLGYQLFPIPSEQQSRKLTEKTLEQLRSGESPIDMTVGLEVEGPTYDNSGRELISLYEKIDVGGYPHPELLSFTLETATRPMDDGTYARTPVDIAVSIARAILHGYQLASLSQGKVVYSSVPEGGSWNQAQITPHLYLQSFAPKVLLATLQNAGRIPNEVIDLYKIAGVDILNHLETDHVLNWPTHALHVHSGVPLHDGLADPRCALAMGTMRLTQAAKMVSLMLSNTRHFYGQDTGYHDVRAIIRRLLPTAHDSTIPLQVEDFISSAITALEKGEIHSLPRYPASGQHDRLRLRSDGDKKTIESIDAPMNPDLRLVLAWVFFNQIMDVIALDALYNVGGNEARANDYLKSQWGDIFSIIPTMGKQSSFEQDLHFHTSGYQTKIGNTTYGHMLKDIGNICVHYGNKYPAIKNQAAMLNHIITTHLQPVHKPVSVSEYLGTEHEYYEPNGKNNGILTSHKPGHFDQEMILVQSFSTLKQAEALVNTSDIKDLYSFFGMI